ncbi:sulfatase [Verrucomicrobiaceae bacterium R5-34]|nr:sulfatase [Verrucomicrobiaceae bacterium R5-34]
MHPFFKSLLITCHAAALCLSAARAEQPNFIIILSDDQGYNDLGCFGSPNIKTPNIDQMAKEGRKFTSFYVPSPVCSPSRAGLLTGCYPKRIGMEKHVLFPKDNKGLHPEEVTIADMLKARGYATACIGKWHVGHRKPFLPTNQGFDSYYGIPYSNDMVHPDNKGKYRGSQDKLWLNQDEMVKLWNTPLMQDEEIIELPVNQRTITRRYTDKAIEFITANKEKPFFLYLPHSMPHIPLFVPEDAYDPDPKNAYKAVIEHIDAEVGRVVDTVKQLGLSENTYIIYTSDNGPWLWFKNHGGKADPLREGKGTTYEGGQRVPCVMWAPGRIPAGTETDAIASTIDLLPTLAQLTGSPAKTRGEIDGTDISPLLLGTEKSVRDEFLFYTSNGKLEGLRQGDWKLLMKKGKAKLFNLAKDIGEQQNQAKEMPEKVSHLLNRMRKLDEQINHQIRPQGKIAG